MLAQGSLASFSFCGPKPTLKPAGWRGYFMRMEGEPEEANTGASAL